MKRAELLEMLATLKLAGTRASLDEILAQARRREHSIEQTLGELLTEEIAEKRARSIRYQMGIAKLPLAKELPEFEFV